MARYPKASLPSEIGRGLRRATWIFPKAMTALSGTSTQYTGMPLSVGASRGRWSLGAGGSNIFD